MRLKELTLDKTSVLRYDIASMNNARALTYNDIYLIPNKCVTESRSNASTVTQIGSNKFKLPIVPANMVSTINYNWSRYLDTNNYFYIMHRFNNGTVQFVQNATRDNFNIISISTGVTDESLYELEQLKSYKIDYVTIDVAHGHSNAVARRIDYIKKNFKNVYVIAGNVASGEASKFLCDSGADCVKVGIGSGVICTTKLQTGFHIPMFTCIQDCASCDCDIMADGGIQYPGDVAKALTAGADFVMAGGLFACCSDSPATAVDGKKVYFGSTSMQAKQKSNHIEGRTVLIDSDVCLEDKLFQLTQALQSSISYAGGIDLKGFRSVNYKTT